MNSTPMGVFFELFVHKAIIESLDRLYQGSFKSIMISAKNI